MPVLTLDTLRTIMRTCGVDDGIDLDGDIADTPLDDLGYDSLAVMFIAAVVKERTGVALDDVTEELRTPQDILRSVNSARAQVS